MAASVEERQAGDFHRRQPRAEGRRLSSQLAAADRRRDRRRDAGGRVNLDRGRGRADDRRGFLAVRGSGFFAGCGAPRYGAEQLRSLGARGARFNGMGLMRLFSRLRPRYTLKWAI